MSINGKSTKSIIGSTFLAIHLLDMNFQLRIWIPIASLQVPRKAMACNKVQLDGVPHVIVAGGTTATGSTSTVEIIPVHTITFATWTDLGPALPNPIERVQ